MIALDPFTYCNKPLVLTHGILSGKAFCPHCGSENVIEQGYEHNHRHHCYDCNETWWITRA